MPGATSCCIEREQELKAVPGDIPSSCELVDLSQNFITRLPSAIFRHQTVCNQLYLYGNEISIIEENAFQGLSSLEELNLVSNRITHLPAGVFRHLTKCTVLKLYHNQISVIEENAFQGLSSLQVLRLDDNQISVIPDGAFTGLSNLQELSLYQNEISDATFRACMNKVSLDLDQNQISEIAYGPFLGLENLSTLDLGSNKISEIPDGAFSGLSSLYQLFLYENQISGVSDGAFTGLTTLLDLYLDQNQISGVSDGVFAGLINLRLLNLDQNQISQIPNNTDLSGLSMLSLAKNQITEIHNGTFTGIHNLQYLWLGQNQISEIPDGAFTGLGKLGYLSLDRNQISVINDGAFSQLGDVKELYLGGNQVGSLSSELFANIPRPFTLDLYHNGDNLLDCQALCWLKKEWEDGTIHWSDPPQCMTGQWNTLDCLDHGECLWCVDEKSKFVIFSICFYMISSDFIIFVFNLSILHPCVSDLGQCPEPGGVLYSTRSGAAFPYHVGDTVNYTCKGNYSGGGTTTCQQDGSWSGTIACAGIYIQITMSYFLSLFPSTEPFAPTCNTCVKNKTRSNTRAVFVTSLVIVTSLEFPGKPPVNHQHTYTSLSAMQTIKVRLSMGHNHLPHQRHSQFDHDTGHNQYTETPLFTNIRKK